MSVRTGIACVITAVWALNYGAAIFIRVDVPIEVNPPMLLVAGWLFGKEVKDAAMKRKNDASGT